MVAGNNVKINVWHITEAPDDTSGGAVLTGTMSYSWIDARIEEVRPSQLLLQQGLETVKTFSCLVRPSTMAIYERDEIEVIWPPEHLYYQERLRIVGKGNTNFHPRDKRGYLLLTLQRSVIAHANQ